MAVTGGRNYIVKVASRLNGERPVWPNWPLRIIYAVSIPTSVAAAELKSCETEHGPRDTFSETGVLLNDSVEGLCCTNHLMVVLPLSPDGLILRAQ